MTSRYVELIDRKVLVADSSVHWLKNSIQYEVIMGSQAYGVTQDSSDQDIYGWVIPPKHMIFPHVIGHVDGFGPRPDRFDQFQQHHVNDKSTGKQFDFTIYSIVKYFNLLLENNPNIIDSLFVPEQCILQITSAGKILRDARKTFLHKGAYHKFHGYAHSQIHKMRIKQAHSEMTSKRREDVQTHGYDTKFAYHCVRLLAECEQILLHGDINLHQGNELLKSIRRGEFSRDQIITLVSTQMLRNDRLYLVTKLPDKPNWKDAQMTLMNILESHYGCLQSIITIDRSAQMLSELQSIITKYKD